MGFETPVLLITFNRPSHTAKVFSAIKAKEPKILFVFRDGPRPNNAEDILKCQAVIDLIRREVDWDCQLKTCFESKNLGCGRGPAKAITWFFENVEAGIILEDDCLPAQSFFPYCEALLDKYRNDHTIYMVTGTNPLKRWGTGKASYLYAFMGNSLGWATWRRAWNHFDYSIKDWAFDAGKTKLKKNVGKLLFDHYAKHFDEIYKKQPRDAWDFQWLFTRWYNSGKTIVPAMNLVSNIGFNSMATHTKNENDLLANLPLYELNLPLISPSKKHDHSFDWMVYERFVNPNPRFFTKRIMLKIARIITGTN